MDFIIKERPSWQKKHLNPGWFLNRTPQMQKFLERRNSPPLHREAGLLWELP